MDNDRVEISRQRGGQFEIDRLENGKRVVYRTDDEGDFIRQHVENLIADFEIGDKVKAMVEPQGDRWFRIEISFANDTPEGVWMDIGSCFDAAFSKHGKHWYDCRDEGQDEPEGHKVFWWIVRHRDGAPWI